MQYLGSAIFWERNILEYMECVNTEKLNTGVQDYGSARIEEKVVLIMDKGA